MVICVHVARIAGYLTILHVRMFILDIWDTLDTWHSGVLASLTISNNRIGSEQEAKIKQICAGKSIKCTL